MEELGWHKPLVRIQCSGRTAFFFLSLFFLPFSFFFPWRGFKALLQGVAFPRYFIPSAYFSLHQVSVVHIHPSVPGDGCADAEILVLVEEGSCCLVLPLAEEPFVQTCLKSAKGLNQNLEGVVTAGAPHYNRDHKGLSHIPYSLLKFWFLYPPCSCLDE